MTYLWKQGEPIQVGADRLGAPEWIGWRGQRHPVEVVVNRWRVDEDWWIRRVWREYFKLVTATGLLVIVYHNLVNGEWYLQQLYN